MLHGDRDDRLLAALRGDAVTGEDRDEVFELRAANRVGTIARSMETEVPADLSGVIEPVPALTDFDRIAAALGDELAAPEERAEIIPLRRNRAPRVWLPSLAAAAIALLAGAAFLLRPGDATTSEELVLDTLLEGEASAELIRQGDDYRLRVEIDGLTTSNGYLELWLIDPEVTQLVSLGPIRADGEYPLPSGLDPAAFPVVDVSVESFDGDPTHSGQSVFRGQFEL